ncbi:MAG TPA: hypothetical protein VGR73_06700 [Bryobacteraceae bacterium]|nr:hypothetical protein [Bryobacteraceae bacterium]
MSPTATAGLAAPATVSARRLRWFKPTLADLLFLAVVLWLIAYTVTGDTTGLGMLKDSQTGYHIRIGEYVLANHQVPHTDFLSFTKPGERFFAWEWLSGVGAALLYEWGGLRAIVLFSVLTIGLTIAIMLRHLVERGANVFVALFLMHLAIGASSIHYLARPHIFTLLFFAYALWVLDRDSRERTWLIWTLVPLAAVWANLHGGFAGLPVTIGILAAGALAEWVWARDPKRLGDMLRYSLLAVLCFVASIANPYGLENHRHIVKFMSETWYGHLTQEYQPPDFLSTPGAYFGVALAAGIVVALRLLGRKKIGEALVILAWAYASSRSMRHIPLYMIVVLPALASELAALWRAWVRGKPPKTLAGLLDRIATDHQPSLARIGLFTPLVAVLLFVFPLGIDYPKDFPEAVYPTKLINRHAAEIGAARVFTSDGWGHYLTYRFPAPYRIYIDGRTDFFGEAFTREYLRAINGEAGWDATFRKYGVQMVLVPSDYRLAAEIKRDASWRLVEDDGSAALFARKVL